MLPTSPQRMPPRRSPRPLVSHHTAPPLPVCVLRTVRPPSPQADAKQFSGMKTFEKVVEDMGLDLNKNVKVGECVWRCSLCAVLEREAEEGARSRLSN